MVFYLLVTRFLSLPPGRNLHPLPWRRLKQTMKAQPDPVPLQDQGIVDEFLPQVRQAFHTCCDRVRVQARRADYWIDLLVLASVALSMLSCMMNVALRY